MGLTDINSNKYDAVIRFKKSLPPDTESPRLLESLPSTDRKVNDYGEIVVRKLAQVQKRLNKDEIKLLITEYESGKSTYALAKQFGCHRTTVSDVLKRNGVNVTKSSWHKKLNIEDVISMYENMYTTAAIAEKYEVYPQIILRCLRAEGVKIRSRWDY